MNTLRLAEKAYENLREENDVDDSPESFAELPKSVQQNYLEIAEKGGDSTPFGQEVARILAEEGDADDKSDASGGAGEGGDLDDTAAELDKHKWEELRDKARDLGIEVPDEWNKDFPKKRLIDEILAKQAEAEANAAAAAAAGANSPE